MSGYDGIARRDLAEAFGHCRAALRKLDGASMFITGGTGFFGRWLLALLAHARSEIRIDVTVLTRDPDHFRRNYPELAAQGFIALKRGDVRWFEFPKGRFTHVIHAATDTSVAADNDAATLMSSIVDGAGRVLEFAASAGIRRLLHVSSGAVYGPQPSGMLALAEDYRGAPDPLDPRSAYGQAKRLAEQMCVCAAAAKGGLEPVIARAFAFVGPGLPLDAHFAIGNFIRDAAAGREIVVNGDGTPLRSYLYAADLAAWLLTLLVEGRAGEAYNVGSDATLSIADLAREVAALAPGASVTIKGAATPGAPRAVYAPDIGKARALGLDVWTPLDEAIRRTMAFARKPPAKPASPHRNEHGGEKLTFVIDVDGVVASLVSDNDYARAEPLVDTIASINALHAKGHRIVMLTARGSATGIDWRAVTEGQFARWGLRYHELHFGKPAADYYIDDRLMPIGALQAMARL
jgi:nucleoside-diphosphate-sugar epimerase